MSLWTEAIVLCWRDRVVTSSIGVCYFLQYILLFYLLWTFVRKSQNRACSLLLQRSSWIFKHVDGDRPVIGARGPVSCYCCGVGAGGQCCFTKWASRSSVCLLGAVLRLSMWTDAQWTEDTAEEVHPCSVRSTGITLCKLGILCPQLDTHGVF